MSEDWTIEIDGIVHWAADKIDTDADTTCQMYYAEVELTCVKCLTHMVEHLTEQLMQARHELGTCLQECTYCSNSLCL